jgi:hypothetical protein
VKWLFSVKMSKEENMSPALIHLPQHEPRSVRLEACHEEPVTVICILMHQFVLPFMSVERLFGNSHISPHEIGSAN